MVVARRGRSSVVHFRLKWNPLFRLRIALCDRDGVAMRMLRCAWAPKRSTSPGERRRSKKNRKRVGWRQAPRRSASQVPEHSPPFQEPVSVVPESLPEPVALLLPALTVTVIWPLLATLPLMVAGLEPSARRAPLWMRIG